MIVDIVIPTWNRKTKLDRCLKSIYRQDYPKDKIRVHAIEDTDRLFAFGVWNRFLATWDDGDAFLYLCDDTELDPGCISAAVGNLKQYGGDALIGLFQKNIVNKGGWSMSAMSLVGRKFAERFPKRQLFCPDYSRFHADSELGEYARSLRIGIHCQKAGLFHYHPAHEKSEMDETHRIVREQSAVQKDKETYRIRKERGLLWGKTFDLVNT